MDIQELIKYSVSMNASDLHLSTGEPPLIRVDGDLEPVEGGKVLDEQTIVSMLADVIPEKFVKRLPDKKEIDLSITAKNLTRLRVNIFHQSRGISAALRTIPLEIPTIEGLGLPEIFYKLCQIPHGLILVTGPTGSGKSTTLAAMVNYLNESKHKHIITIEDPIEYLHKSKRCLIQQREVHRHTESFQDALKFALREDPDYILVGEMRDLETIRLALTAAETGHLVFATLHTSSAAKTIDRIIDVFPLFEKDMVKSILSESLQAVISQVLVKRHGGGRTVAQEIMLCTTAIRNLIRENKTPQIYSAIQTGHISGMKTLDQDLHRLIKNGVIDSTDVSSILRELPLHGNVKEQ